MNFVIGDEEGRELAILRETLDSLTDDQRRSKPSQRESTEANDTERSISSTSRANESATSPTDGHARKRKAHKRNTCTLVASSKAGRLLRQKATTRKVSLAPKGNKTSLLKTQPRR